MTDRSTELFRAEALSHHDDGSHGGGDVLRISPEWIPAAYWLLLLVIAAGAAYGTFGTLTEYASGPAVVRVEGRTLVTAPDREHRRERSTSSPASGSRPVPCWSRCIWPIGQPSSSG